MAAVFLYCCCCFLCYLCRVLYCSLTLNVSRARRQHLKFYSCRTHQAGTKQPSTPEIRTNLQTSKDNSDKNKVHVEMDPPFLSSKHARQRKHGTPRKTDRMYHSKDNRLYHTLWFSIVVLSEVDEPPADKRNLSMPTQQAKADRSQSS